MITLRHRLISAALETEVLSRLYKRQAAEMGFDESHMHMRYIQFDYAVYKENAGQQPPAAVNEMNASEEQQLDKFIPAHLHLAVNELEEGQVGKLSFRTKETLQQVMSSNHNT